MNQSRNKRRTLIPGRKKTMRVGDLVHIGPGRGRAVWVVVPKSQGGLILASGYWYSPAERRSFQAYCEREGILHFRSAIAGSVATESRYGKINPLEGCVIGHVRTQYGANRWLR